MRYVRSVALIADKHVGSRAAIFPPYWKSKEGNIYEANPGQLQIYDYWLEFCTLCDYHNVDTVILQGDALHGINRKEFGGGLITSNLKEQKDIAVQLLKMIVSGRKFYVIDGSGYHESLDYKVHDAIAEALGGIHLGGLANLRLTPSRHVINVAHGESAAALYQMTVSERAVGLIKMAQADGKLPKEISILSRGHWHRGYYTYSAGFHVIQIPCWSAWDDNKIFRRYYGKMQPDIGGVILKIDSNNDIMPILYIKKAPHILDMVRNA